ncbi:DUF3093 domain-containing protein [Streptomyces cinereoruber]|uniref:DUF3093 domain-containing protein n=1 Tax=Streptomyces cinereoruber TaxID=67260 RepID=UPI00362A17E1
MILYQERLSVPRAWIWIPLLACLLVAALLLPLGPSFLLPGMLATTGLTAWGLRAYGRMRISVTTEHFNAGHIQIPVTSIGFMEILDPQEALAWRTHQADTHAWLSLRSYVPTALRVEIDDQTCSTPYIYVSTRQPNALFAVLSFARNQSSPCG